MLSALRLVGIGLGLLLLALGARRVVRAGTGSRMPGLLQAAAGLALAAVAFYPELAGPVRDLLGLSAESPGRLLALLIVSIGFAYPLLFYAVNRAERASRRTDALVRALALADAATTAGNASPAPILVGLPAHNEAETPPRVLEGIPAQIAGRRTRVLVVDDGSTDRTPPLPPASGMGRIASPQLGGGGALRTGYLAAAAAGYDIVVTLTLTVSTTQRDTHARLPDSQRRG